MRINTISQNNNSYSMKTYPKIQRNIEYATFTGRHIIKDICTSFPLPTTKLKDFTVAEYNMLNNIEKKGLRLEYKGLISPTNDCFYKNVEDLHEFATENIKKSLDMEFGKENYTLVTIGRSVSSIGKVLGYKIGEENVKNIPLSEAWRFAEPDKINKVSATQINPFKQYLDSIGLKREDINKSGKTYVITDYCSSGNSLLGAKNLLKSDMLLGENAPIVTKNILDFMPKKFELFPNLLMLSDYLKNSRLKPFSFVKKNCQLSDTGNSVVTPQKADTATKLVWFKLLDNAMQNKKNEL